MRNNARNKSVFYVVLALLLFVTIEGFSYLLLSFLTNYNIVYLPPDREALESLPPEYLQDLDPLLGAPSPKRFGTPESGFDHIGSRLVPAKPDWREPPCISLYGNSFVWGSEVTSANVWGNLLSEELDCRVNNFGVPSYGIDQAFLRFRFNIEDKSPIIILGYSQEAFLRNVTQLRYFLDAGDFALKPRFILSNDGRLELIPIPISKMKQFADSFSHPEKYYSYEYFRPGVPSGLVELRFPYSLRLFQASFNFQIKSILRNVPRHTEFYDEQHPSKALPVTSKIIQHFDKTAKQRGKEFIVIVMPGKNDFEFFEKQNEWVYEPLLESISDVGINYLNVGEYFVKALEGNEVSLDELFAPGYHYSEKANELMAQYILEFLNTNRPGQER